MTIDLTPKGLPSELLHEIYHSLEMSGTDAFDSMGSVRRVFRSEERLKAFAGRIPDGDTLVARIHNTVGFAMDEAIIYTKEGQKYKENLLRLFLEQLVKREAEGSDLRETLQALSDKYAAFLEKPEDSSRVQQRDMPAKQDVPVLEPDEFQKLISILSVQSYWRIDDDRVTFIDEVLYGNSRASDISGELNLSGKPRPTASHTVKTLIDFRQANSGQETLGLLLNRMLNYMG
ncbi:MAG: hypothetical protein AAF633_15895, partial [Chloroflexota bacterium]